jgi:hypothetical protein
MRPRGAENPETSTETRSPAPKFNIDLAKRVAENQALIRTQLSPIQQTVIELLQYFNDNATQLKTKGWLTVDGMVDMLLGENAKEEEREDLRRSLNSAISTLRDGTKGEEYRLGVATKIQPGIRGKAPLYFHRKADAEVVTEYMTALETAE